MQGVVQLEELSLGVRRGADWGIFFWAAWSGAAGGDRWGVWGPEVLGGVMVGEHEE